MMYFSPQISHADWLTMSNGFALFKKRYVNIILLIRRGLNR